MKKRTKFLHEKEYVLYFSYLIEIERQEEIKFHKKEIKNLSAKEREKRGRTITSLRIYKEEINNLGKYLLYLRRDKEIKNTEIKEGDVVLLSHHDPLNKGLQANVEYIGRNTIILLFENYPKREKINKKNTYRIDLYVNETTYKRMKDALSTIKSKKSVFPLKILLGQEKIDDKITTNKNIKFFNKNLNDVQKEAVIKSINAKHLYLIHGPPGTGKTTTLVECITQLAKENNKIMVCADSNTAVDNILKKFSNYADKENINYLRVGCISRINKKLLEKSLDYKLSQLLSNSPENTKIYKEINEKERGLVKYIKPTPQRRRGLSYDEILKLSIIGKSKRGISLKKIKSMAKYIKLKKELEIIRSKLHKKKEELIRKILNDTQVIFTTNATAGSEILKGFEFDVLIMDEATQSTEPSSIIPLVKSKKIILAGDHKQLPPTIISEKAKREGLEISLFERLIAIYPENSIMLKTQYRMNETIMNFSNQKFYGNKLIAHHSVKEHTIKDKGIISPKPITFIDVSGLEKKRYGSKSKANYYEAIGIKEIIKKLIPYYPPESIGIITPYKDQVEIIKKMLKSYKNIEISTVDGFQGREKEIIIISLVRSNKNGNIGFLSDYRRLNVALTRARKKIIVLGNSSTLKKDKVYKELIDYIKQFGEYISMNVECARVA